MWQGNGVLRGIEATARVVYDKRPQDLTKAEQLTLAAAVKEPLRVMPPGANKSTAPACTRRANNPEFEPDTADAQRERANQCRVLHRAISMANLTLSGDDLAAALSELRAYQRDGIIPVNPFEPISTKKLVNLSSRTRAALPDGLIAQIKHEAEDFDGAR